MEVAVRFLKQEEGEDVQIGVLGNSLGGTIAIYGAALLEGIDFCIASSCFSSFRKSILRTHHCSDLYIPSVAKYFEFGDIVGIAAPKKILLIQGVNDFLFPLSGVRSEYRKVRGIYRAAGSLNSVSLQIGHSGHRFYKHLATQGLAFLQI